MHRNQEKASALALVMLMLVMLNAVLLEKSLVVNSHWYKYIYVTMPLLLITVIVYRKKTS